MAAVPAAAGPVKERRVQEIQYTAPTSVAEAIRLLGAAGGQGRMLGGGTDLLIQLRAGARSASHIVDAKRIDELNVLELDPRSGLRIGAAVPCFRITGDANIARSFPGLVEAAELIGSTQIQSRATLGGNLCNGSPAADTTPALIALDAQGVIAGPSGRRTVAVKDFITAPGKTVLAPDEILVELRIPAPAPGSADCYQRFIPRNEMDIAVVGVGASITLSAGRCVAARIALGAVGPTPIVAGEAAAELTGKTLDDAVLGRAASAAMAAAKPITDMRGTAEFRSQVVGVLTRRVVAEAARRAAQLR
jgi:CO/xanthine dehydrogenase FAD-binding subunit